MFHNVRLQRLRKRAPNNVPLFVKSPRLWMTPQCIVALRWLKTSANKLVIVAQTNRTPECTKTAAFRFPKVVCTKSPWLWK